MHLFGVDLCGIYLIYCLLFNQENLTKMKNDLSKVDSNTLNCLNTKNEHMTNIRQKNLASSSLNKSLKTLKEHFTHFHSRS